MSKLQKDVLDEIVKRKQLLNKSSTYLPWIVLNGSIAIILMMDLNHGLLAKFLPFLPYWVIFIEFILAFIFCANCLVDIIHYFYPLIGKTPITLNQFQKKLLSIHDYDSGFSNEVTKTKESTPSKPVDSSNIIDSFCLSRSSFISNSSASILSDRNLSFNSMCDSSVNSPNKSITSDSWTYHSDQPAVMPFKSNSSFNHNNISSVSPQDYYLRKRKSLSDSTHKFNCSSISDEQSLIQYLKEFEDKDQSSIQDLSTSNSQSVWNFARSPIDYTSQFMKCQYQIASKSPQSSTSHKDDSDSPTKYSNNEVWKKFDITPDQLDLWVEKLRKWITETIIVDVVNEINSINKSISKTQSRNLTVGEVSISTLGQIAFTSGCQIPHLNTLLPFLDITPNQEYLVHRLKGLASGGYMGSFKWNGGGTFKGKQWDEHLPTDAMIVMHQFCSYLDARTPFHPNYPDGKTFTSQYFVKTPDKPDTTKKDCLYIYQSKINPPVYKLVTGEITYELAEGYNNMFLIILLFLYHVKKYHSGMLGRLSLGKSGVNMLWIFES